MSLPTTMPPEIDAAMKRLQSQTVGIIDIAAELTMATLTATTKMVTDRYEPVLTAAKAVLALIEGSHLVTNGAIVDHADGHVIKAVADLARAVKSVEG